MRKKWQRGYKGCRPTDGQLMSFRLLFFFVCLSFFFSFYPLVVCLCWASDRSFCLDERNHMFDASSNNKIQKKKTKKSAELWQTPKLLWNQLRRRLQSKRALDICVEPLRSLSAALHGCYFAPWNIINSLINFSLFFFFLFFFLRWWSWQFFFSSLLLPSKGLPADLSASPWRCCSHPRICKQVGTLWRQTRYHTICPPSLHPSASRPFPFPHFKAGKAQMKVWKEMEKQIVHLYLGGDQTLEQIFATLSPCRTVARCFWGGEAGGPSEFPWLQIQTDKQTRELVSRRTFRTSVKLLEQEVDMKFDTSFKNLKYAWIYIIIGPGHSLSFVSINPRIVSYK